MDTSCGETLENNTPALFMSSAYFYRKWSKAINSCRPKGWLINAETSYREISRFGLDWSTTPPPTFYALSLILSYGLPASKYTISSSQFGKDTFRSRMKEPIIIRIIIIYSIMSLVMGCSGTSSYTGVQSNNL